MKYSSWGGIKKILVLIITFNIFLVTNQLVIAESIEESIIYVSKSDIGVNQVLEIFQLFKML